ncbi:MAG: class II glutamine amidotransferase [SAR324 cluster bacterium]|nr:class II glutamine amidotransferase [SAR324 cluster bacterium]
MCELFAMSSLYPTTVSFSLEEFAKHGGLTGPHQDGWGIAFYAENDVRLIKDADAASQSACVKFIEKHDFISDLVISHIRKATQGGAKIKNTQPFSRELGGRMHVFAHNGDLKRIRSSKKTELGRYQPVGETDSEYAFCSLMASMQDLWTKGSIPSLAERLALVSDFAGTIRKLGPANFLYSDSEYLYIHGHQRKQTGRPGFHPPGLFTLCRSCSVNKAQDSIEGLDIKMGHQDQKAILVASVPLTEENWIPLAEGEIRVLAHGEML